MPAVPAHRVLLAHLAMGHDGSAGRSPCRASVVSRQQADAIATIGLGALISTRLLPNLLGSTHSRVYDYALLETWVRALEHLLATVPPNVGV